MVVGNHEMSVDGRHLFSWAFVTMVPIAASKAGWGIFNYDSRRSVRRIQARITVLRLRG
jgi:hypothetical protein